MTDTAALLRGLAQAYRQQNEHWTEVHVALSEIAAPAYREGPRGEDMAVRMRSAGLVDVGSDELGNVFGRYPLSATAQPRLAVSAHLDTVFGPEVDVRVRREGHLLHGPGCGDDAAGLVMLLALAEALGGQRLALDGELWLVATVGEEGAGNLRGARKLAADGVAGRTLDAFITLDTSVPGHIIRHGTHSRNHDLTLTGPGGHAWSQFGIVSPSVALARIVTRVSEYEVPEEPRTTVNCGILEAGFAPNAIPERAHGHINLRSADAAELERLDAHACRAIEEVLAEANRSRKHGPELRLEDKVNSREGGETPLESPLVQAAVGAARRLGFTATHPVSSTDANAFLARGKDAICLYRGQGGGEHTLQEWYDADTRPEALELLTDTVLRYFGAAGAGRDATAAGR